MAKTPSLSAGQKKLAGLNIKLPLLPTTSVGSLPKSAELTELRYKVSQGVMQPSELGRKERIAAEAWLRELVRLGLDVLVDGEVERGDMVGFFAGKSNGFDPGGIVRSYGNRYYRKPVIKGKVEWKGPLTSDTWQYAQRATHSPLKAIVTGPYTMMDWSFNEYYSSRESTLEDLTKIIRKEITGFVEAGAKIIQIDEPAISARPDEFNLISDALKELTKGFKAYFVLHHCYGDLAPVWAKMQRLPIDNFSLESANSGDTILNILKKTPSEKDISIGVVDSHSHTVETPQIISDRIKRALKVVPANQLWISTDCGLKTRTTEETSQKLTVMIKAAVKARAQL